MKAQLPIRCLIAAGTIAMAGCGTTSSLELQTNSMAPMSAQASATLRQGFDDVHKAIFDMIDSNHDGSIDEYEAGPYFNLQSEFPQADRGHAGTINYNEFMAYATKGGFLQPNDTPDRFLDRERNFLAGVFNRLDQYPKRGWFSHGDGYLEEKEVSRKAVSGLGLGFGLPRLHIDVKIRGFKKADFKAADKTGDGRLSQGEFEDLYMMTVVELIKDIPKHGHHGHGGHGGNTPPASGSVSPDKGDDPQPSDGPSGNDTPPSGNDSTPSVTASSVVTDPNLITISTDDWAPWTAME